MESVKYTLITYNHPSPAVLSSIYRLVDEKTGLKYGEKILNPLKYFADYLKALQHRWRNKLSRYCIHLPDTDFYITNTRNIPIIEGLARQHMREIEKFENELKTFLKTGNIERLYYKQRSRRNVWRDIEQVKKYVEEARRILEEKEGVKWEEFVDKILSKSITSRFRVWYIPLLVDVDYRLFKMSINQLLEDIKNIYIEKLRKVKNDIVDALKCGNYAKAGMLASKILKEIRTIGIEDVVRDVVDVLQNVRDVALRRSDVCAVLSKLDFL